MPVPHISKGSPDLVYLLRVSLQRSYRLNLYCVCICISHNLRSKIKQCESLYLAKNNNNDFNYIHIINHHSYGRATSPENNVTDKKKFKKISKKEKKTNTRTVYKIANCSMHILFTDIRYYISPRTLL